MRWWRQAPRRIAVARGSASGRIGELVYGVPGPVGMVSAGLGEGVEAHLDPNDGDSRTGQAGEIARQAPGSHPTSILSPLRRIAEPAKPLAGQRVDQHLLWLPVGSPGHGLAGSAGKAAGVAQRLPGRHPAARPGEEAMVKWRAIRSRSRGRVPLTAFRSPCRFRYPGQPLRNRSNAA